MRRFSTRSRLTNFAGEWTNLPHSTAFERIDFSVSSSRLTGVWLNRLRPPLLPVGLPGPAQALTLALLDPVGRDFVQSERPKPPIRRLDDLAITSLWATFFARCRGDFRTYISLHPTGDR